MKIAILLIGFTFLISCSEKQETPAKNKVEEEHNVTTEDSNKATSKFQNGDLIFQTSLSSQSKAIQLATGSVYSHVGIVYEIKGEFFVFEAVQPVKLTPLNEWIDRGKNDHYVVKRLRNAHHLLTPQALNKMKEVGEKYAGKNYDIHFDWSDDKMYCSELVWKIYKEAFDIEIGQLQKLGEFNLEDPIVKRKLKERYGHQIPLEEKVISPLAMFESDLLIEVSVLEPRV